MHKGWIACVLASITIAATSLAGPATQPTDTPAQQTAAAANEQSAVEFVRMWTKEFNAGRGGEACKTYFDTNALLETVCGTKYNSLSDADKIQCQQNMQRVMLAIHANPMIQQTMAQASFSDFSAKCDSQGRYIANYVVTMPDHVTRIPNSLLLEYQNGKWKVIDMATRGSMMGPALQNEYKIKAADMSPNEYTAELAKWIEQKFGKAL